MREAGPNELAEYLAERRVRKNKSPSMVAATLDAAVQQDVVLPGEATTAVLVKSLARRRLDLDRAIRDANKLIAGRFRAHPQAWIIKSLPGIDPILGAEFIVATGGDVLATFASPGRLASYVGHGAGSQGLWPSQRQSPPP